MPDTQTSSGPSGRMIVVVGPSGAGKDTLLDFAARHFSAEARVRIVRRVITRTASAGGEVHESLSPAQFEARAYAGDFAVSWAAHGLHYGIPRDTLDDLEAGCCLLANGSRSALPLFRRAFGTILVINVTARPEILAERLLARGRESRQDILARLQRASLGVKGDYEVETIDNSGTPEEAGRLLVGIVERHLPK